MVTMAPQAQQQFRVIRTQLETGPEQTFRLVIDELPVPEERPQSGLNLVLRYSVPVFVNSVEQPEPSLEWLVRSAPKGQSLLQVKNTGTVRAQLSSLRLISETAQTDSVLVSGLAGYVLPQKTWQRIVPATPRALQSGRFKATVNAREVQPSVQLLVP